jgi:hypothetical protein
LHIFFAILPVPVHLPQVDICWIVINPRVDVWETLPDPLHKSQIISSLFSAPVPQHASH